MKITGIIAEYNPFHNGHKYQIEKAREFSDGVVAIMSGSFVQRGGIAITDKWTRAEVAVKNGADLVLELPVIYSMNTAQKFARGAVEILDRTNVINYLYFGSECDNIEKLIDAAILLANEPKEISKKIKCLLDNGMSYPAARAEAFSKYVGEGILSEPNNILAVEYIKALLERSSSIEPLTLCRKGTNYHDLFSDGNIASASAIREMLSKNKDTENLLPYNDFKIYDENMLGVALLTKLRTMSLEEIANINDVTEGLEYRIKDAVMSAKNIDDLCNKIKTKRYPMSKIRRIIFSALLGITKSAASSNVDYLRVIAMNETGAKILKEIKKVSELDIVTKVADYKKADTSFELDILSTDIFALCGNESMGMDYKKSPVIIK